MTPATGHLQVLALNESELSLHLESYLIWAVKPRVGAQVPPPSWGEEAKDVKVKAGP